MEKLVIFSLITIAACGRIPRGADHHGDGHDENCVDISRYGPVQYNESLTEVCSYKLNTNCVKKSEEVCVTVPITKCEIVGYTECDNIPSTQIVRDDSLQNQQFVAQDCEVSSVKETITEIKKMPVCQTVTKQQCDTKWVVNELGEKVWAGNENCKDVTWEDCTLEDREVSQEVEVYDCTPSSEIISYQTLSRTTSEVTTHKTVCEPKANPVCSHTTEVQCDTVEWEDCTDTVTPNCFSASFRVPYQEFDHRLRCSVGGH